MSTENEKPEEAVVPQQAVEPQATPRAAPIPVPTPAPVSAANTNPAPVKPVVGSVPITDWIITFFLLAIPVLNIILLLIWAFSSDTNPSKANFAKAYLIIFLIFAALLTLAMMLFGATFWGLIQSQADLSDYFLE